MNPIGSPINSSTPKKPPMPKEPSPASSGATSEDSTNSVRSSSSRIGFHRNFPVNPLGCTAYRTWEHTHNDRNDQSFRRHVSHVSIPFNTCAEVTCSIDDDRIRIKNVPLMTVTKDMTENSKTASPRSTSPINSLPTNRAYRNNTP